MSTFLEILGAICAIIFILKFIAQWIANYRFNKMMRCEMTYREYMGIDQ